MNKKNRKSLKSAIRKILIKEIMSEGGEILTKGAFGSGGRAKSFVTGAKARAEEDPEGLMKDLGITGPVGGEDLQKVLKILNSAIHTNQIMSKAYRGSFITKDTPRNKEEEAKVVAVNLGELDRKNGIRFLAHTLTAAQNANFLNLKESVQFDMGSMYSIIIYSV